MLPPYPNLIPVHNYAVMATRIRKITKLQVMREQSMAKRR